MGHPVYTEFCDTRLFFFLCLHNKTVEALSDVVPCPIQLTNIPSTKSLNDAMFKVTVVPTMNY